MGTAAQAVVTPTLHSTPSPGGTVGLQVFDTAQLAGGVNPTGSITFRLYGPGDTSCASPVFTSTTPVNGNGAYNSQPFTTTAAGTYLWTVSYSGDANNSPVGPTACGPGPVLVGKAPTVLTTDASPAAANGSVHDTATLAGGFGTPTGTITFFLSAANDQFCAAPPIFTSTVQVNGNGTYDSGTFVATQPGTYHWRAVYSGDANSLGAGPTNCIDPAEAVVVTAGPPATLATSASPSVAVGGQVHDTATLSGGTNPTGTITFHLYGPADATCSASPVFSSTAAVSGAGSYDSGVFTATAPGTYRWRASYSGDASNPPIPLTACGDPAEAVVVTAPVAPTLATSASPPAPGAQVHDTATLGGSMSPTGTITFRLYGPADATCSAAPLFSSTVPVAGNASYVSGTFTATASGTYRWVAAYSGDTDNLPAATACDDPAESVTVVIEHHVAITTTASPAVALGGAIHDSATLSGGTSPTGTITFSLYGPDDASCANPPAFTATVAVSHGDGTYDSGPFAPAAAGTYRWRAAYGGDATNAPAGPTACDDPAEAVTVNGPVPTLATVASPSIAVGGQVHDTATLSGGTNPTGTITFRLYGPGDATCSSPPAFTSTVPVSGNGSYDSASFSPTAPGSYRWRASYSGDATNPPAGPTACADPAEAVTVSHVGGALSSSASGSVAVGGLLHDTATLVGFSSPTGTITFHLYGPADPSCSGPPLFTASVPVSGNGSYDAPSVTASTPGTYRWVAAYSGDAVNGPAGPTPCGDPAESVVVVAVPPELTTTASSSVPVGGVMHDTAAVSGAAQPTGSVTFRLYGPADPTCASPPLFTATVADNDHGFYTSTSYTPTATGTYRWTASYSGDAVIPPLGPLGCSDPAESVVVTRAAPAITTTASPAVPVGGQLHDTATLAGGFHPTGTITFSLFGPTDPTCAGAPIFTATAPVAGEGSYDSATAVPAMAGTYRWTARYGGDAANAPAGPTPCGDPAETVAVTAAAPVIAVQKTAEPFSRPAPGGDFTFTVDVTNVGIVPVTITRLVDDVYGDLAGRGSCATGRLVQPGETASCAFVGRFTGVAGDRQTDRVTATAVDADGAQTSASAAAVVSITAPPPSITVTLTVDNQSAPEPGGTFAVTVSVTNTGSEPVTLVSLVDEDLNGKGTCSLPQTIAPGQTYRCTFPVVFTGNAGDRRTVTVTATVADGEGRRVTASGSATITLTDVAPTATVAKAADPPSRPMPGGDFTFSVAVTNTSFEPVTLRHLADDVYGDLDGQGSCRVGEVVAPGATYTCSFTGAFWALAGGDQVDTVTATLVDDDGTAVSASATARVGITLPLIGPVLGPGIFLQAGAGPTPVGPREAPLVRTGSNVAPAVGAAVALAAAGLLLLAAERRRSRG